MENGKLIENGNFIKYYRENKFKDDDDPCHSAQVNRVCTITKFAATGVLLTPKIAQNQLKRDLVEYSDLIDDVNGVNNYANIIQSLYPEHKNNRNPQSWKCSLKLDDFDLARFNENNETEEEKQKEMASLLRAEYKKVRSLPTVNPIPVMNTLKTHDLGNQTTTHFGQSKQTKIDEMFGGYATTNNERKPVENRTNISSVTKTTVIKMPNEMNASKFPSFSNENRTKSSFRADRTNQSTEKSNEGNSPINTGAFRSAREELLIQNAKKFGKNGSSNGSAQYQPSAIVKKSLGGRKNSATGKFIPPMQNTECPEEETVDEEVDERLRNIDPKMVELIRSEIMDCGSPITWNDIAGLEFAKTTIQEIVVWPLLRPDIFTGLRRPPKGILLFGPPGTGKTLIGKCIASQSQSTFFSISASSLTSKWIGDGEKMVRALFAVARCHQPAVIFIDEIDSLLSQRSDTEHESSRRIKTEFLVQLDGATTGEEDRILVIGATNRPQELDEAARRRLVKRLYIPLPEFEARQQIVERLMSKERNNLTVDDIQEIATQSDGYSGADMKNLCAEASLGPIRSIDFQAIQNIHASQVRPINVDDFKSALNRVRASVSSKDLDQYVEWNRIYGSGTNY